MSSDIVTVEPVDFDGFPAWKMTSRSGATAVIAERGATLLSWEPTPGAAVIAGHETGAELEGAIAARGLIAAPWSGRIAGGKYRFAGKDYQLPLTDGQAIHGLVFDQDFTAKPTAGTLSLSYDFPGVEGYPWPFKLQVNFSLGEGADEQARLSITISATNTGKKPIPLTLGWHPYVAIPGMAKISNLAMRIPARTKVLTDGKQIPLPGEAAYAGVKAPVEVEYLGAQEFDTSYRGLVPDEYGVVTTTVWDPATHASVELTQEPGEAPVIHVFTADRMPRGSRESIALEPMSHFADAFNRADSAPSVAVAPGDIRQMTATLTYRDR